MGGDGDAGRPGQSSASSEPLVDREAEVAAIDDLLGSALAGSGRVLWIEGAPGLGKSRLLGETVGRAGASGVLTLRSRARELEREYPFALALQLFEPYLARCQPDERQSLFSGAAGLAASLVERTVPGDDLQPAPSDFALLHGLYWLTVNISSGRPLVVCVDDLQWSDAASARFLLYLADRLDGLPISLVVVGRPSGPGQGDRWLAGFRRNPTVPRVVLQPLRPDGVADVVRHFVPSATEEFCAACAQVTDGNPFRVHELLREVGARRISPEAGSLGMLRDLGAATLGRAALFRLVRLGPAARAVAEAVATLGDGATLRWAAALAELDVDTTSAAADALVLDGILEAGEPLSFAHPLIRESIEGDTPHGRRGVSHRRAALMLAGEYVLPEIVAAQLLEAPGVCEEWAVDVLREAAGRARAHGAPDAAIRYLQRALDEPPRHEVLPLVLTELGAAEVAVGSGAAISHLRSAHERLDDPVSRAGVARLLSRALANDDRAEEASGVIETSLAELGGECPDASIELLGDYLVSATLRPSLRQIAADRVDSLVQALPAGSDAAQRSVSAALALRSAQYPDPVSRTVELVDLAWGGGSMLEDHGPEGPGWTIIGWALLLSEEYSRAESVLSAVIEAAQTAGSATAFATASYYRGFSCWRRGELIEAQADAEQAIGAGDTNYGRIAGVLSGLILLERGDLDGAEAALSTPLCQESRWMPSQCFRLHAEGRLAFARGRTEAALERFLQAGDWLEKHLLAEHTVVPWRLDAARAALALGDRCQARGLLEPLAELAEQAQLRITAANTHCLLGLVEGGTAGIDLLRRGAEELGHSEAGLDHAYSLAELGAALRRADRKSDARSVLGEALGKASRLGAAMLAARVKVELMAAGGKPRREAVAGVASLTPSEQRVGRMAAEGHTNAQIAQALFVTLKTVEFHLRHVYQKLQITGRHQLEDLLSEPVG
jgi:DNA-binding CsgD family transcriptional regulator